MQGDTLLHRGEHWNDKDGNLINALRPLIDKKEVHSTDNDSASLLYLQLTPFTLHFTPKIS
jgi:hypothetical protein